MLFSYSTIYYNILISRSQQLFLLSVTTYFLRRGTTYFVDVTGPREKSVYVGNRFMSKMGLDRNLFPGCEMVSQMSGCFRHHKRQGDLDTQNVRVFWTSQVSWCFRRLKCQGGGDITNVRVFGCPNVRVCDLDSVQMCLHPPGARPVPGK